MAWNKLSKIETFGIFAVFENVWVSYLDLNALKPGKAGNSAMLFHVMDHFFIVNGFACTEFCTWSNFPTRF